MQKAAGAEDAQHQLVERDRGVGAEIGDAARRAERLELLAIRLVLALERLSSALGDGDLAQSPVSQSTSSEVAAQLRPRLAPTDLQHERLEAVVAERVEPSSKPAGS